MNATMFKKFMKTDPGHEFQEDQNEEYTVPQKNNEIQGFISAQKNYHKLHYHQKKPSAPLPVMEIPSRSDSAKAEHIDNTANNAANNTAINALMMSFQLFLQTQKDFEEKISNKIQELSREIAHRKKSYNEESTKRKKIGAPEMEPDHKVKDMELQLQILQKEKEKLEKEIELERIRYMNQKTLGFPIGLVKTESQSDFMDFYPGSGISARVSPIKQIPQLERFDTQDVFQFPSPKHNQPTITLHKTEPHPTNPVRTLFSYETEPKLPNPYQVKEVTPKENPIPPIENMVLPKNNSEKKKALMIPNTKSSDDEGGNGGETSVHRLSFSAHTDKNPTTQSTISTLPSKHKIEITKPTDKTALSSLRSLKTVEDFMASETVGTNLLTTKANTEEDRRKDSMSINIPTGIESLDIFANFDILRSAIVKKRVFLEPNKEHMIICKGYLAKNEKVFKLQLTQPYLTDTNENIILAEEELRFSELQWLMQQFKYRDTLPITYDKKHIRGCPDFVKYLLMPFVTVVLQFCCFNNSRLKLAPKAKKK